MQIDWITVSAQIINFLILLYLLKRFLYHPVMDAMAKREQRIAASLNEAQQRENEASREIHQFRDKQLDFEKQRDALMEEAQHKAEQRHQELVDEVRQSVEQMRHQWQQDMVREKAEFFETVRQQTAQALLRGLRRVLADMADSDLEAQMVRVFVKRLKNLATEPHTPFASALQERSEPVCVITTFTVSDEVQSVIAEAVSELAGKTVEVRFEQGLDAVCGIQLQTGGQTMGWTLGEYLDDIAADLEHLWVTSNRQKEAAMA